MLPGRRLRRIHSIAFILCLGACGSGGGNNDADTGGGGGRANADGPAAGNRDRVAEQSNSQARFGQASFSSASFVAEAPSGLYGADKFR